MRSQATGESRPPFDSAHLVLNEAPLPVSATFNPITDFATVTFDKALVNGVSDANDWRVYYNLLYSPTGANATVLGNVVTFQRTIFLLPTGQPDTIQFVGSQHDLFGVNGLEVQPFQIPYTVI